tara:strand:+ start:483 stop:929 length:447 start_codon:yes stop_codon:yes gene_type:complete
MAYQGSFASGARLDAANLNEFANVTIASVANLSVLNSTNTSVDFDTEVIDVGGWFAPTSQYITPDVTGIYLITCNVIGLDSATRGLVNVASGGAIIGSEDQDGGRDFSVAVHTSITAGDTVSAALYQNSGSTQTPDVYLGVQLIRQTG